MVGNIASLVKTGNGGNPMVQKANMSNSIAVEKWFVFSVGVVFVDSSHKGGVVGVGDSIFTLVGCPKSIL